MSIIRKHKAAFAALIALELMGLGFIFSVLGESVGNSAYAASGLLVMFSWPILIASIIGGIVGGAKKAKAPKERNPADFEDGLAAQYMVQSKFGIAYWIIILLLSPVTSILLVYVLNYYMVGVMLMTLGAMIFMISAARDIMIKRFYCVRDAQSHIVMKSGEDPALLDELYGDYVHVYLHENWDERKQRFLVSLLCRERALDDRVVCYRLSDGYLGRHMNYEYGHHYDDIVLVPFSQFEAEGKGLAALRHWLDQLSLTTYDRLVEAKYGSKCSLEPSDYAHSQSGISLRPFAAGIHGMSRTDGDIHIALGQACAAGDPSQRYHNCLLVLRNAQLQSEAMSAIEQRLMASDTKYITGFSLSEDGKRLSLTVIIDDDEDAENWDVAEEEYDPEYILVYGFERMDWHWDGHRDASKAQAVLDRTIVKKDR